MTHAGAEGAYSQRVSYWQEQQTRFTLRIARLLKARRVLLGVLIALLILADKERVPVKITLITPVALIMDICDRLRRRAMAYVERSARAIQHYEDRLARLAGTARGCGPEGRAFLEPDHPAAADLDVFGPDSLFARLSLARTVRGEAILARWLTAPASRDEVLARQRAVTEHRPRLEQREQVRLLAPQHDEILDVESLALWSRQALELPPWSWLLTTLLSLSVLGTAGGALWSLWGSGPLLLALAASWAWGRGNRSRCAALLAPLVGRAEELGFLTQVPESPAHPLRRLAWWARLLDARLGLPQAPLAAALLIPMHVAHAAATWRRRWGTSVDRWLETIGTTEALSSLGGYAFERDKDPFPELTEGGPLFEAEALVHPLLPGRSGVANDVRLDSSQPLLMISGSNMSGKSTLLRAVGVATVLAWAGAPVPARRLRLSRLTVGATARVSDSLQARRSRFYAEVLRIRHLVALAQARQPLLFLLDELFAGTNAEDRYRAAEAIVRTLLDEGAIGLVTTHDLALTAFAEALTPRARNYHFGEQVVGEDLHFDHRMRPGPATTGNALILLRAAGLLPSE